MVPAEASEQEKNLTVKKEIPIPEVLKNNNLVIEILGHRKQEFRTFYSN